MQLCVTGPSPIGEHSVGQLTILPPIGPDSEPLLKFGGDGRAGR